jgi:hypothetical protein
MVLGHMHVGITDEFIQFFIWYYHSEGTMVLGSIQPLTGSSTRNLPVGRRLPARKADFTAICVLIV